MTVIKTLLVVVIVMILGTVGFVYSGIYNVAADEPYSAFARWALQTTRVRSIEVRKGHVPVPANLDTTERFQRGALDYAEMCEGCHLGPGVKPTPFHVGLKPEPPDLGKVAEERSAQYLFWTIKHGIKLTGMPAWGETHGDEELWDIVAFLEKLPQVSPGEYAQLSSGGHGHGT